MDNNTFYAQHPFRQLDWMMDRKNDPDAADAEAIKVWMHRGAQVIRNVTSRLADDAIESLADIDADVYADFLQDYIREWLSRATEYSIAIEGMDTPVHTFVDPVEFVAIYVQFCHDEYTEVYGQGLMRLIHTTPHPTIRKDEDAYLKQVLRKWARMKDSPEWAVNCALAGYLQTNSPL